MCQKRGIQICPVYKKGQHGFIRNAVPAINSSDWAWLFATSRNHNTGFDFIVPKGSVRS